MAYKHWKLTKDEQNILWLGLDRAGESMNTLSTEVLDELNSLLQEIAKDNSAIALVIHSLKKKGFIAGADVKTFTSFEDPKEARVFLQKGQAVFARLEALKIPSVAMIHGFCLGGGYELALACTYRIASDEEDTRIGLPEVLLGIHPGWGGTVRLPRLMGGFKALSQVMLTGQMHRASRAKALGMVDEAVPLRQLKHAVLSFIAKKPATRTPAFLDKITDFSLLRKPIAALMRKQVAKKVRKEHYPAPYALISLWEQNLGAGERAYVKEVESVEQLVTQNNTSKNLIRAFLLKERLKAFAKESTFKAKHVHVIGAGIMGGDIAAWCALKGLQVTLQDQSFERIAPAMARAQALYKKRLKKTHLVQAAMDRLLPDPEGLGRAKADVIIEAVFENLAVKQDIFKSLEQVAKKDAILASNTSSIPLDEISSVMKTPARLVGIHFFNPVSQMELVEVVSSTHTAAEVTQAASAFVNQVGKLPLPVKSSPGFLVNRVLMPYLMECMQLIEEGVPGESIDEAALAFGMFMGPVELADVVGMDVCLAVAENLTQHFGGSVPQKLRDMVQAGTLGKKSGRGFYTYVKGKAQKKPVQGSIDSSIASRLILRIINESAACLREGVVADSDLLDAAMIFATGFAPFRGGPMNYAHDFGKEQLNDLFKSFEQQYGVRFKLSAPIV